MTGSYPGRGGKLSCCQLVAFIRHSQPTEGVRFGEYQQRKNRCTRCADYKDFTAVCSATDAKPVWNLDVPIRFERSDTLSCVEGAKQIARKKIVKRNFLLTHTSRSVLWSFFKASLRRKWHKRTSPGKLKSSHTRSTSFRRCLQGHT